MLKIFNQEFFGFESASGDDDLLSISITVDPQEFDLKSYKRSPFSSIIVNGAHNQIQNIHDRVKCRENLISIIKKEFSENDTLQYNLYSDEEYEKLTSKFDTNCRFHTMIYSNGKHCDNETDRRIMIGAFPVKGIVSPITKSNHYKLYNGCFINCKPFLWNNEYYNKIVYVLVDIQSHFSFQEFIKTDHDEYGILVDHRFYLNYDSINYEPYTTYIPYNGRDELFTKPPKNIFYLSDVPKDIMMNRDKMSVKI